MRSEFFVPYLERPYSSYFIHTCFLFFGVNSLRNEYTITAQRALQCIEENSLDPHNS